MSPDFWNVSLTRLKLTPPRLSAKSTKTSTKTSTTDAKKRLDALKHLRAFSIA